LLRSWKKLALTTFSGSPAGTRDASLKRCTISKTKLKWSCPGTNKPPRAWPQGQGDQPIGSEFIRTDWASIAEGYGAVGLRVRNPGEVQAAVLEALSGQKPAVVDVQIDPQEPMQERLKSNLGVYGSY
jgi:hypothetical protein